MATDDDALQGPRRHTWSTGRYPSLAPNLLPATANLVNDVGVSPGDRVLDVGCGTGNVALTARQKNAEVVGLDLTRPMLDLAVENAALAAADGIDWITGDVEALPFRDGTFDAVLSNFGHVFSPDAERAADELLRVAAPGGTIGFTAWSPEGLVGSLTELLADHVSFQERDPWAHLRWGDPEFVRSTVGDRCELSVQRRIAEFRYVSPRHFWWEFAEEAGPLSPVLGDLDDEDERAALRANALTLLEEWFAGNAVRVEYLQVRGIVSE